MHKTLMVLGQLVPVECGEDLCDDCPNMDLYDDGKSERMHCTIFGGRLRPAPTGPEEFYRLRDCIRSTLPPAKDTP
jgi:hypothetical protein